MSFCLFYRSLCCLYLGKLFPISRPVPIHVLLGIVGEDFAERFTGDGDTTRTFGSIAGTRNGVAVVGPPDCLLCPVEMQLFAWRQLAELFSVQFERQAYRGICANLVEIVSFVRHIVILESCLRIIS